MAQKPVKTIKHGATDGSRNVEAAVWRNKSDSGSVFHSVTFKCQYKEGSEWKTTTSYGVGDLYQLMRCATDAAAFLFFENLRGSREEKEAA